MGQGWKQKRNGVKNKLNISWNILKDAKEKTRSLLLFDYMIIAYVVSTKDHQLKQF